MGTVGPGGMFIDTDLGRPKLVNYSRLVAPTGAGGKLMNAEYGMRIIGNG